LVRKKELELEAKNQQRLSRPHLQKQTTSVISPQNLLF